MYVQYTKTSPLGALLLSETAIYSRETDACADEKRLNAGFKVDEFPDRLQAGVNAALATRRVT
jgi:hypothetical protein